MQHRTSFLDFFKAIATQGIVLHHLVSYGFIAQLTIISIPLFRDITFTYGRLLVQIFFVIGGFLVASKINKNTNISKEITKRYLRLASPYIIAIFMIVIVSLTIKYKLNFDLFCQDWAWLSNIQSFNQVLSHIFLVHDIFSQENLSTGVWYIAIDFQLFIISMLLVFIFKKYNRDIMIKFLYILISISLFITSKDFDYLGFYFFYSYGLGIILYTIRHKKKGHLDLLLISALFISALIYDFRIRILFAYLIGVSIFFIIKLKINTPLFYNKAIIFLSRNSYSVFLTHFSIIMIANFIISKNLNYFYNHNIAWCILLISWLCAIILGQIFFKTVEKPLIRIINHLK